jgi:hypothetical protein
MPAFSPGPGGGIVWSPAHRSVPGIVARAAIAVGLTAVLVAVPAPIRLGAETDRETTCILWNLVEISPGLTLEPGSGSFRQQPPGTIECDGPVLGRRPTGPGNFAVNHGRYGVIRGASCSGGDGTFVHGFRIPTEDGELRIDDEGTFTYGPLQGGGVFGGTFTGRVAAGRIRVTPVKGDCVTAPLTVADVRSEMTFNR